MIGMGGAEWSGEKSRIPFNRKPLLYYLISVRRLRFFGPGTPNSRVAKSMAGVPSSATTRPRRMRSEPACDETSHNVQRIAPVYCQPRMELKIGIKQLRLTSARGRSAPLHR